MTLHVTTTHEKLEVVERLIRSEARHGNDRTAEVLKAVASDLRARLDGAPTTALIDIDRRVCAVKQSQGPGGYTPHALHELGQGVASHWPVVKLALERFAEATEGGFRV